MVLLYSRWGFPHSSVGKASACFTNAGDPGSIPRSGRSAGEGIGYPLQYSWASIMAQLVKNLPANTGDLGLIPGLGRSPGEDEGYPLQYSSLENSWTIEAMGLQRVGHNWETFTFTLSWILLFVLNFMLLIIDINFLGLFDNLLVIFLAMP